MMQSTTDEKMTVDESYGTAVATSNMRVDADRRTPADMVIAAGMNTHRTGMELLRLRTEWDRASKPKPMTAEAVERLADTLEVEPAKLGIVPNPNAGLVAVKDGDKIAYKLPIVVAQHMAHDWHRHELGLLLQGLKTLPNVRAALVSWHGEEDAVHIVAATLIWWLSPACPGCDGRKVRIVAGTGRTNGKPCGTCKGTGERKIPHSGEGRRVLGYINECLRGARVGLNGKFRHHHSQEK